MNRLPDWLPRFRKVIETYRDEPLRYGYNDCALLWARCVDAMTGSHWAESLGYSDIRGAVRFLRREGGLEAAVTARFGAPLPGYVASRGDGCLIDRHTLGVCVGASILVFQNNWLVPCALHNAQKYWRV